MLGTSLESIGLSSFAQQALQKAVVAGVSKPVPQVPSGKNGNTCFVVIMLFAEIMHVLFVMLPRVAPNRTPSTAKASELTPIPQFNRSHTTDPNWFVDNGSYSSSVSSRGQCLTLYPEP
jgi:hypothetical protein